MPGGLYVPFGALNETQRKRALDHLIKKNHDLARQQALKAEQKAENEEKSLKTKPTLIVHNDPAHPDWPIVVVGAGAMWKADMIEMAKRRRERPRYRTDHGGPRVQMPDPMETLRSIVDQYRRDQVGLRTFHIKNNPISKKG